MKSRSTIACVAEQGLGDAVPARAATPLGLSRFASSCQHRIAIAEWLVCFVVAGFLGFALAVQL